MAHMVTTAMTRLAAIFFLAGISRMAVAGSGWNIAVPDAAYRNDSVLCSLEKEMVPVARTILYGATDSIRLEACRNFSQMLGYAIAQKGSFSYRFDSLVSISRLFAPDSSFRIFTWNLPSDNGTFLYYGFIQRHDPEGTAFLLSDRSDSLDDLEHRITGNLQWPGAHYYQVILNESAGKKYYTLLGWDGHTRSTTRKLIEILTFGTDGRPVFGAAVFPDYGKGKQTRVIFEHSSHATMSLKYDLQRYKIQTNKNPYRPRYRYRTAHMIVFDHLEPMDPSVAGQFSYYIPVGNVFDAFVFEDGSWRFQADVDARNPEIQSGQGADKPVEHDLFPPAEKK